MASMLAGSLMATTVVEVVAKSIKASNHEGHEEHKGKEKLFFVLFVSFVVRGFYAFCLCEDNEWLVLTQYPVIP